MSKKCPICGNKVGLVMNFALKDGKICTDCGTKIGLKDTGMASMNVAELLTIQDVIDYQESNTKIDPKQYWTDYKAGKKQQKTADKSARQEQAAIVAADKEKQKQIKKEKKAEEKAKENKRLEAIENGYVELMAEFKADKAWHVGKVYFDEKKQEVLVKKNIGERMAYERTLNFHYSDLENYDVIEDPATIEKKHGVSRSIIGGLVAGPTGAVLGAFSGNKSYDAVSKVAMVLYFKGNYHIEAVFLNDATPTSSSTYAAVRRSVMQVSRDLDKIIAANTPASPAKPDNAHSSADDLRELKQLLDDGILTEEEFTAKKKQILGI